MAVFKCKICDGDIKAENNSYMEGPMKILIPLFCIFISSFVSCASKSQNQRRTMESLSEIAQPGPNQSEIVIQFTSSLFYKAGGILNVFVDGEMIAQVEADTSERIIVSNGNRVIRVRQSGRRFISLKRKIDLNSQRVIFSVSHVLFTIGLHKEREVPLIGIGNATLVVSERLIGRLPRDTTIAIISVSTTNEEEARFIINELEHTLVNNQYRIVDRHRLDAIRTEQRFQLSGDVSDESAVSIGEMSGAGIVITGTIIETGNTKTLSIKALDVRTSEIITMEREHY